MKCLSHLNLSLLTKFSIIAFLITAAIAIALAWGIQWRMEQSALRQEAENAAVQVSALLNPNLKASDFTDPLSPDRFAQIGALIRENILQEHSIYGHIVRIKIWNRDGQVIYSDEKSLVGRRFPENEELKEALSGKIAMEVSSLKKEENIAERGRFDRLMEVYVPLRPVGSPHIMGVFEIYHDLTFLKNHIAQTRWFIYSSIGLGFLILYASLFLLVRNASRELIRRNDENAHLYEEVKQQLAERKAAEEKYRTIFENAVEGIFQTTPDGHYLNINPALARMHGYDSPEELIESTTDIQHQIYVDSDRHEEFKNLLETQGEAKGFVTQFYRKDSSTFWASMNARAIRDDSGTLRFYEGTIEDITGRKRAEEEIQQNYDTQTTVNSILRLSLENIPLKEILSRTLTLILSIPWLVFESRGCIFLVEDTPEVLVMKAQNGLAKPIQMSCAQIPFGKCLCGRTASTGEIYFTDHIDDSHEVTYEGIIPHGHYCVPIMLGGRILGVLNIYVKEGHRRNQREEEFLSAIGNVLAGIINHKRTEKEMAALQEQLRQSQKMEAIGQLAGGVAHDFNNLLTVIKGYSQLSLMQLNEGNPLRGKIEEIQKAADRAASLTRQLLAFSRRQVMEMRVLDLNAILGDLDKMLQRIIGEDIELRTVLAEDLGRVRADPGQIEQVIINLAVNAKDAMPNGGKLTIETANVDLDEEYARNHVAVTLGRYVMLAVSDTGVGMVPEIRERIFEPFFTTKEKGMGTGLGLSTVYGIVKQSGGNIWVYSEPGHGTTFKIYLPQVDEPPEEMVEKVMKEELPRGSETILIVEDNEEVRKLAMSVLEKQGYNVLEASNGDDALHLPKERKESVHLILVDVVMPGISGRQLVEQFKEVSRDCKVLYMSGYTENGIVHHGILEKGMNYIQKPFSVDGLARKVREVLDH